jgi:hypothetical protein
MLAAAALGLALALRLLRAGRPWSAWVVLGLLCIVNPAGGDALQRGHPEEVLGAALLAGAVLVARARPVAAGVLTGLAIATKQWALLGLVPVAFLAPAGARIRMAAVAVGVAALLAAPMAIGNPTAFRHATQAAVNPPGTVKPLDIWFPFATKRSEAVRLSDGSFQAAVVWRLPHALDRAAHWIVIAVCLGAFALWWRRRARAGAAELLLAFALLVRVVGDPRAHPYHHAPFVAALAVAEATRTKRFPFATVMVSAALAETLHLWDAGRFDAANAFYLAWALPTLLVLGALVFNAKTPLARGPRHSPVVGDGGLEPPTSSLSERRSNRLS